ncbi:hypothetical protein ACFYUY_22175 [Kitasatospora sp. NPDC004745]|uniref:hypothetical protein n=1 Tax=Kitasatospora sp. NPDC004745 TaxID=3364019 RepID=UPI003694576E
MYRYLSVRSDARHRAGVPACVLVEHLDAAPGLRRSDAACYLAADGHHWLSVVLAACDDAGNHAVHEGRVADRINLVELICSSADGRPGHDAALARATGVADLLGWEVVDSDTGELLHGGGPSAVAAAAAVPAQAVAAAARCTAGCPTCSGVDGAAGSGS